MLFRFTIISDEVDEFLREIKIDADSTFLDFCEAILASCNYEDDQVTSFYITNDEWEKQCEITREDMGFTPYDEDVYTMDKTSLRSLLDDVPMRLKFIFDTFNNRAFYIELKEMIPGKNLKKAQITRSIGDAPAEILVEEKPAKKGAKPQQKVRCRVTVFTSSGALEGEINEVLGYPGDKGVDMLGIIREKGLRDAFPPEVTAQAEKTAAHPPKNDGRRDLRNETVFTVDGEDARDLDDAVSVTREENGWLLGVHIADVSAFVRPGTAVDEEAYLRGTSVYFPDRVLPMLPKALSNGVCSLNQD